jgi:DNA replication protein DnaC
MTVSFPDLLRDIRGLKLAGIAQNLDIRLQEAVRCELGHSELIALLIEDELNNRAGNALQKRRRQAHLPPDKTLENYDFAFQPALNKKLIFELAAGHFLDRRENIIFMGQPGTGKTHLAVAIAQKALLKGNKVVFVTAADMIETLLCGRADGSYAQKLKAYLLPELLVIDELGFKPLPLSVTHDFFDVIAKRHEQKSTVITSNKTFAEWDAIFADKTLATAIIDRLIHHCHPIVIKGESYRMKERLQKTQSDSGA